MSDLLPHSGPGAEHHVLVQAPVAPVDADGVMAIQVGTVVFGVLTLVGWWYRAALEADGHGWWLWVCVVGFCMGLPMILFLRHRRSRRAATADTPPATLRG